MKHPTIVNMTPKRYRVHMKDGRTTAWTEYSGSDTIDLPADSSEIECIEWYAKLRANETKPWTNNIKVKINADAD